MQKQIISLAGLGTFACISALAQKQQPNIIYIFTDQQTASAMSCAGNPDLSTPNMDRLAHEGVRFVNAYCAAPLSTPSRAAMMTGAYPSVTGNLTNGTALKGTYHTHSLGMLLSQAGYECAYAGKWHLPESSIPDAQNGFRHLHDHNDHGLADACGTFLTQKHSKPFFLVASLDNPHNICEYVRDQNIFFASLSEAMLSDCPNLPANFHIAPFDAHVVQTEKSANPRVYPTANYSLEDWRRYRHAYYRLTEAVDAEIGRLLAYIDQAKLWDNTIVIFSSDHGDGNASHQWNQKSALYEETTNIPLIIRMPRTKNRGEVKEHLVNNGLDFYATICDFAGVKMPAYALGKSMRPVLENNANVLNEAVVVETLFDNGSTRGWAVRTQNYKYVVYDKGRYREQLYDMNTDRGEMVNLAIQSSYRKVLDEHRTLLNQWHERHGVTKDKRATPIVNQHTPTH